MTNLATYIKVYNHTDHHFILKDHGSIHGYWDTEPPSIVYKQTTSIQFELKDHKAVASGSEGNVTYGIRAGVACFYLFFAKFCCSWSADNNYVYFSSDSHDKYDSYFTVTVNGRTYHDECPESGHPILIHLHVQPLGTKRDYSIE